MMKQSNYDSLVIQIKELLPQLLSPKRLSHVMGVEEEALALGSLFGGYPELFSEEDRKRLHIGALLHDITKERNYEEQIELCETYHILLDGQERQSKKLLHARTGCAYARAVFGRGVVDDDIYSAIRWHTTGRADMTTLEALLYLADWIEPTRVWPSCIELRHAFYDSLQNIHTGEELLKHLSDVLILSYDMTIKDLIESGKTIDSNTLAARNSLISARQMT